MYKGYRYVSLENLDIQDYAREHTRDFLREYDDKVIFDEAQRVPELFSYLQGVVDERRTPGRFILSGSQNFLLRKNITQSLAGRVGIARLLPLDHKELRSAGELSNGFEKAAIRGGYPGFVSAPIRASLFYSSYLASYVERDVVELISPTNLGVFRRFIRVCAAQASQTINYKKLAQETSISIPTAKVWLGILEQSYIIFRLPPFFRNIGKRLVKTPKLYFYDTGLLTFLLSIEDRQQLLDSGMKGEVFENMLVADAFKSAHHTGRESRYYFYRDKQQTEVDLLHERAGLARFYEFKSASDFRPRLVDTMEKVAQKWDRPVETNLVYAGTEEHLIRKTNMVNWRNLEWKT